MTITGPVWSAASLAIVSKNSSQVKKNLKTLLREFFAVLKIPLIQELPILCFDRRQTCSICLLDLPALVALSLLIFEALEI